MKKPTPFGKYFLLERINVGGMAEVFRAKAFGVEGFERLVAVKRILPNIAEDKEFIRMFIEEAKLSVQLNHANIAQIFDLGVVDGAYYIALEHVHGRDLRGIFDRCRQLGATMPVAQACFVVMKLCEGLDYAHNKRDQSGRELSLVHRDVSPQNVLVSFEGEVKIIDFGIAKAAGKGSKTQAGILKGKFGYMSPEQVRGLPVDRRSDVFSCGIVLYELLTGERLFVGESDFSTLEKVRNVEILPPSTYNRKIPDELERIVLKALAKDVEDRYQNSIDLHDELQAFVYTAGEFYSRKDLAGWMKKTFGKEIEEETAKLESYRQLKPPSADAPSRGTGPRPVTAPPPPSPRRSQAMPAVGGGAAKPPPPPPSSLRTSQQVPVVAAAPLTHAAPPRKGRKDEAGDLSWDDDELETQIYDNPEDDPKLKQRSKQLPLQAPASHPASSQPMAAAGASASAISLPPAPGESAPDLSSLVSTAKGWESAANHTVPNPASTLNGIGIANGRSPQLATGSNKVVQPGELSGPHSHSGQLPVQHAHSHSGPMTAASSHSGPMAMASSHSGPMPMAHSHSGPMPAYESGQMAQAPIQAPTMSGPLAVPAGAPRPGELYDSRGSFSQGIPQQRGGGKSVLVMIAGGAAVAAVAIAIFLVINRRSEDKPAQPAPAVATAPVAATDQNTGFDLYVTPSGVMQWKLDGESRTDRLPSRIRGISPGSHSVQIDAPTGFLSQTTQVEVAAGKAARVDIKLEPVQGIHGVFESNPAGAMVSLIVDGKRQELGPSPAKAPLDPRHTYQVLFEKEGFVSVNRPIVLTGALEERTAVNLDKAGVAGAEPPKTEPPKTEPPKTEPPKTEPPKVAKTEPPKVEPPKVVKTEPPKVVKTEPPKVEPPKVVKTEPPKVVKTEPPKIDPPKTEPPKAAGGGVGSLALGSKPSCEIYVDGASTGLYTPQPALKLPVGKRRITLVNNEYGIKESFVMEITSDKPAKMIKDYSDRLNK